MVKRALVDQEGAKWPGGHRVIRKALIRTRARSDHEGADCNEARMAKRAPADQDNADGAEGAECLRERQLASRVLIARKVLSGCEGAS